MEERMRYTSNSFLSNCILFVFAPYCSQQYSDHRITLSATIYLRLLTFDIMGEKKKISADIGGHIRPRTAYLSSYNTSLTVKITADVQEFYFSLHTLKMRRLNFFCHNQRPSLGPGHHGASFTSYMYCLEHHLSAGQKCKKIVQGRAHSKRDIVDTSTHASCAT